MTLEFIDIVNIITSFLLLFFIFFLLTHKKGNKLSNRILAAFLFSNFYPLVVFILYRINKDIFSNFPHIIWIAFCCDYLMAPLIYFYTKSLVYRNFTFKKKDMAHLTPLIIYSIYLILRPYVIIPNIKYSVMIAGNPYDKWEIFVLTAVYNLLLIIYAILALRILKLYKSEIKRIFASIDKVNLSWLSFILISFALIWFIEIFNSIIVVAFGSPVMFLSYLTLIVFFIVANIIVYKGLKQPEIFNGIEERPKYEKSLLSKNDSERYLSQLKTYIEKEKPYLIPSLSINKLAEKLSIQPRYLSQVINESFKLNFFDFINKLRVEEAKNLLKDDSSEDMNILEIGFKVGFNSKASFNRAFNKHVGMAPTEYKKLHQM